MDGAQEWVKLDGPQPAETNLKKKKPPAKLDSLDVDEAMRKGWAERGCTSRGVVDRLSTI